jgi:regulator of extracellular matrix RemA (YlzA/DUF370 family)
MVHPLTLDGAGGGTVEASEDEATVGTQIINHILTDENSTQNRRIAPETIAQRHLKNIVVLTAVQPSIG